MDEATAQALRQLEELEARVRRAVETIQSLRRDRDAARAETEKLRAALRERGETLKQLESRLLEHQTEREQLRSRIEKLLSQVDSLSEEKLT